MKWPFIAFPLSIVLISGCHLPGCGGQRKQAASVDGSDTVASDKPGASTAAVRFEEDEDLEGLRMILREAGPPRTGKTVGEPVAAGKPLSKKETSKLLARVPKLTGKPTDKTVFAMRADSSPPPKTGKRIQHSFPPKEVLPPPEQREPEELEILRFAPEGKVDLAPHLSITFSKSMVAVTSQDEAKKNVPVKLTPTPAGDWRWLGARTLQFKPEGRFPMATEYQVEIKKGTQSATGDTLKKTVRFDFATPPLKIKRSYPTGGPHNVDPVIFIEFNQKIDSSRIAKKLVVKAGDKNILFREATADEVNADDTTRLMVQNAEPGRYVALKPKSELPKSTHIRITLSKGAPSAEGPLKTTGDQTFSFRTYASLKIIRHSCREEDNCSPETPFRIVFNNPLGQDNFDPATVEIAPALPHAQINLYGRDIRIDGRKQGRTKYTVTVPSSITDIFGQQLEKNETLSFHVGPAEKTLFGPGKMLVTLDPTGPSSFPVHSINHPRLKVVIHRVTPKDWLAWKSWLEKYRYQDKRPGPMPGKRIYAKTLKTRGEQDSLVETPVPLKQHVQDGFGQFIIKVEPTNQPKERWRRQEILAWVQVTKIGITAFSDYEELIAWTSALSDGKTLSGVSVSFLPGKNKVKRTDEYGLARMKLPSDSEAARLLVAQKGDDLAILPANAGTWYGNGGWNQVDYIDELKWYTFDDRGLYRPEETARIKGWIRRNDPRKNGDLQGLKKKPSRIEWRLSGPQGNSLDKGSVKLSALSGFDISLTLPKEMNLGTARLELVAVGAGNVSHATYYHNLKVQEFRRPEFEVNTRAKPGPYLLGEEAIVSVAATYFSGGGLPDAPVRWRAFASPASYTPPNCSDYQFGAWSPWWRSVRDGRSGKTETLKGNTDAAGEHHLGIHFEAVNPKRPMNVNVEASVSDINRQTWTAKHSILVHPAKIYVGLKTERGFVEQGTPVTIDAIAVDIDGDRQQGLPLELTMSRMDWKYQGGKWREVATDPQTCPISSREKAQTCTLTPKLGGVYRINGAVKDSLGRKNQTQIRIWVAGGEVPPARDIQQEKLTLIPEKQVYAPGETASLLVQAPFYPAEGVLTIRRSGIVRTERFRLDSATKTLRIPVLESHIPNFTVQVDVVGSAVRMDDDGKPQKDLPRRVAYASGHIEYKVPPLLRALNVKATPEHTLLQPGDETSIELSVTNARGKPVKGAELAVVVADESVLALTGYRIPDPLDIFYSARGAGVRDDHSREGILLADPSKLVSQGAKNELMMMRSSGGGGRASSAPPSAPARGKRRKKMSGPVDMKQNAPQPSVMMEMEAAPAEADSASGPIALRTNFSALALFAPRVKTDSKGRATVKLTLPDSLTRYRITAVAVAGGKEFGSGEANLTARLPLMVRPSLPRFLNFGDRFELPVVVQNQTDEKMTVQVAVRATNIHLAKTLAQATPGNSAAQPAAAGKEISVEAGDRVEVRFPAAAKMAGTARFQVVAQNKNGNGRDAKELSLPVWTPATRESFATYGTIDKGALVQPVRAPGDVWPQFGGLEITTSSTQLQALTDAFVYLVQYPFDCNEQRASRILAIAALRDVLQAFKADGLPDAKKLRASIDKDLKALSARQNYNGGFSFWRRGGKDWPYLSVHVAFALARAKEKGYRIPDQLWSRSHGYLKNIKAHIPAWYSRESAWTIRAYALYVRNLMGDRDTKRTAALFAEGGSGKLPLEAQGWILSVMAGDSKNNIASTILRTLNGRVAETAAGAHFVTSYSDGQHVLLHSNRRVDGILLEALIAASPKSDLIPKLVRGLLGHRKAGRWSNTQENAFILLALDRYFHAFEKVTPNFVSRIWLGERFAGRHTFKGRTTEQAEVKVPMEILLRDKNRSLIVEKQGPGRLYYRVGMRYAPKDLNLKPADYGFALRRVFEPIDDPEDVMRQKDGKWIIKAGAQVRVRLTMASPMRRYHVALVDPLPAGLEPVNPELATSGSTPDDPKAARKSRPYWWWWRPWYEHQNMRDERVEAFTSLLWDGVFEYTYVARATTPGIFVTPPARAEEMYHPETFGRTGTDIVIVK